MKFVPTPNARVWHHFEQTFLFGADGLVRQLAGDSAALARTVLEFVTSPRTQDEIVDHVSSCAGPLETTAALDELLELLCTAGIFRRSQLEAPRPVEVRPARVLLCLTGAIASMDAPRLVRLLQGHGFAVQVAMTRDARRFVSRRSLEALTHAAVHADLWRHAHQGVVPHIQLAQWAELVLICPASATTLSRIARGDCSDVVSAVAIATRAPTVIVPSMNAAMLAAPAVARNLDQLREDGFHVVQSGQGVEVAEAPASRAPRIGPTIALESVVDIVSFILARASSASAAPVDWEHIYRSAPLSELPWYSESVEPDVSAAISQFAPEALRVLDIGAGPGTFAIEMARRGCDVTALDLSAAALDAARVRAADLGPRIRWRVADFLQAHFDESFELAFDRGCLHVLQITQLGAYVKQAAQSLSAGGVLILKTFLAGADHPPGTLAFSAEDIGRLFGSDFTVRFQKESTFLSGATHYPDLLSVLCKR